MEENEIICGGIRDLAVILEDLPDEFEIRVDDIDVVKAEFEDLEKYGEQLKKFTDLMLRLGYRACRVHRPDLHLVTVWKFERELVEVA